MSSLERVVSHDAEHLSHALQQARVSAMQISRGRFGAELTRLNLGGWHLQHIRFLHGTSSCRGDAPPHDHAIVVPLRVGPELRLLGKPLLSTSIGLYAPGGEHGDVMGAGAEETVIVPPRDFIQHCVQSDKGLLPTAGAHHVHRHCKGLGPLRHLLEEIQSAATSTPQLLELDSIARSFADDLSLKLVNALTDEAGRMSTGRPPMPRAAIIKLLRAKLDLASREPMFASEICEELGISFPTLRRIFLDWYGVPPAKYLLLSRYYLARRRLRSLAFSSVTDAAQSCGFWEPSRFAKSYKGIFGELPSATLRSARTAISD